MTLSIPNLGMPGASDLITIWDRIINQIEIRVDLCAPCHTPEYLASIQTDLPTHAHLQLEEEVRHFDNAYDYPSSWDAKALTKIFEAWEREQKARKFARRHFERLHQRLHFMEDAPLLEKIRFLRLLFPNIKSHLYRPVTRALVTAAADPEFETRAPNEHAAGRAAADLVWREDAAESSYFLGCSIYVMGQFRGILNTTDRAKATALRAAAEVIANFQLAPLKQLVSLSLSSLEPRIRAYEDYADQVKAAIESRRPLIVSFRIVLPNGKHAPIFESEQHLSIEGTRSVGNAINPIQLQAVINAKTGEKATSAEQGEYYCLSTRPLQEIKEAWDQAQDATMRLRLRARTTGLLKDRWLNSSIIQSRKIRLA